MDHELTHCAGCNKFIARGAYEFHILRCEKEMKCILPDIATMKRNEWAYQVQWEEQGKPCFVRYKFIGPAQARKEELRRTGITATIFELAEEFHNARK